jgi:di/tricarboxylate transporter
MSDATITYIVLGAAVVVFVWDRLPVALVAVAVALSLWATGVVDLDTALSGFGDQTVVFIASLFAVSEALDASGLTAWAGQALTARVGESRTRLVVLLLALVAVLTALISVNGSVAALIPVTVVLAVRLERPPSQLLMPLAFGAHAGSLLALTGTPVNVIVSDAAADAGAGRFGYFAFAVAGMPLVAGTIAIVVLFGERLLPHRGARAGTRDFSDHARTLLDQWEIDHPELLTRSSGAAEVVIPPRSDLAGERVFPGMVTDSGDLVVLGVRRRGRQLAGEAALEPGDLLLIQGAWRDLDRQLDNVLVVDPPELVRRAVPLGEGAKRAMAVLVAMVALLATGAVRRPPPGCWRPARWWRWAS